MSLGIGKRQCRANEPETCFLKGSVTGTQPCSFVYVSSMLISAITTWLGSCVKDHVMHDAEIIYSLALYRKKIADWLLRSGVESILCFSAFVVKLKLSFKNVLGVRGLGQHSVPLPEVSSGPVVYPHT